MKRFVITVVLSLSSFHLSIAQTSLIDSLKAIISSTPDDTFKVQNLISLSRELAVTDPQNANYYGVRAERLAIDLDYQAGRAAALKYLGNVYYYQDKYPETIYYWEQAAAVFDEIGDKSGVTNMLSNLGGLNAREGDDTKALEFLLRSLAIAEEIGDTLRLAIVFQNIALVYSKNTSTLDKSRDYYLDALAMFEALDDKRSNARLKVNLGVVFYLKGDYDTALYYLNKAVETFKGGVSEPYAKNYIGRVYAKRGEYDKALKILDEALVRAKFFANWNNQVDVVRSLLSIAETYSMQGKNDLALRYYNEANILAQEEGLKEEMRDIFQGLASLYADLSDFRNAFKYQEQLTAIKDSLFYSANQKKNKLMVANLRKDKQFIFSSDLFLEDKAIQDLNLQKEKIIRNAFLGGFIVILIIAFILLLYRISKRKNRIIANEKRKSDDLLLNILPEETANELKQSGHVNPRKYDLSTVLFTDFTGFTKQSESISPEILVNSLDYYFQEFDRITEKHNLEKIKTIGDAYMCVGGIPTPNDKNPVDVLNAAINMLNFVTKVVPDGIEKFEIRLGIHTGPIIAGIVGIKKFQYDVWGNTVNIASLMESSSEPHKINISQATYEYVKDEFNCTHRGQIEVKHGKKMDMYFVEV